LSMAIELRVAMAAHSASNGSSEKSSTWSNKESSWVWYFVKDQGLESLPLAWATVFISKPFANLFQKATISNLGILSNYLPSKFSLEKSVF
jgi:hypothetical protein